MLYHWHEARIWGIGCAIKDPETGKTVDSETVTIFPGVHDLDDEQWAKIKDRPEIKERIEGGKLQVNLEEKAAKGKNVKKTETGLPKVLDNFATQDAVELISGVMEADQLKAWEKGEKRPAVKKAIKEQLKAIDFATKPKDQKGD